MNQKVDLLGVPKTIVNLLPEEVARHLKVIPVASSMDTISVATDDPDSIELADSLRFALGSDREICFVVSSKQSILEAIDFHFGTHDSAENLDTSALLRSGAEITLAN